MKEELPSESGHWSRRLFLKRVGLGLIAFVPALRALGDNESSARAAAELGTFATVAKQSTGRGLVPLQGISLGDDQPTVLLKRGKPDLETITHGNGGDEWQYPGLTVRFTTDGVKQGQRVWQVVLASATLGTTPDGLSVGAAVIDLQRVYSTSLIDYGNGSFDVLLAPEKYLSYAVEGDRVVAIILRDDSCTSCVPVTGPQSPEKRNLNQKASEI